MKAAPFLLVIMVGMITLGDPHDLFAQTVKQKRLPVRVKTPEWYDKVPADDSSLTARGRADSKDQQVAVDKAVASARSGLVEGIDRQWNNLLKAIQNEGVAIPVWTGEAVTLEGSTLKMQKTFKRGRIWTAFVLVRLPQSFVRSVLEERLRRDADWYSRVKDTRAVREWEGTSP
jgi:hypothetical protein